MPDSGGSFLGAANETFEALESIAALCRLTSIAYQYVNYLTGNNPNFSFRKALTIIPGLDKEPATEDRKGK